ncbi:MAG: hypothetical protein PHZ19_02110 [Candidatus Thermoplasmatota archaeon]|nr:hypothetical protein [Candidatus Thermoplasmatota archaeon]
MRGLEKLDEMVFHVIESVATGKDITAEDIEYAARDLYPEHAILIITVIKNKPEFMELWGRKPTLDEMSMAVIEALPKDYTKVEFRETAKKLFPEDWEEILQKL